MLEGGTVAETDSTETVRSTA